MLNPFNEILSTTRQGDNRYVLLFVAAALCLVLDQLTKILILNTVELHTSIPVISGFFNIVHIKNYGAAFGFLNNSQTEWQFYFFALTMFIAFVMVYFIAKTSKYNKMLFIALGLLLGGAIGNFIDRLLFRAVTDFLDFQIGYYHWPAFNIADIGITLGAFVAMYFLYVADKKAKQV